VAVLFGCADCQVAEFGSTCDPDPDLIIDDAAPDPVDTGMDPLAGAFHSEGHVLSAFNGENAKGRWKLRIQGSESRRKFINCWCLDLLPADPKDQDGDGIPTPWEVARGTDPTRDDAHVDNDGDMVFNVDEYVTDTDPNDSNAFLRIIHINTLTAPLIVFSSSVERTYRVHYATNLPAADWLNLQTNIPGNDDVLSVIDTNEGPIRIYRIESEVP